MDPSRTLPFTFFGKEIYWYGVIIAFGFLLAFLYARWRCKDFGYDFDHVIDAVLYAVPLAIVCARIYYVSSMWEEIYSFAAENRALIITQSGEENSLPEDFCLFANRFPEVQTICSHMGCGYDGNLEHQMRAIEMNTNDNLYTDTSSAKSLTQSLIEYAVKRIGSEKILFGTDNSCYFSPCQRARIDYAHIPAKDKYNILCGNALRLFPFINLIYERETAKIKN